MQKAAEHRAAADVLVKSGTFLEVIQTFSRCGHMTSQLASGQLGDDFVESRNYHLYNVSSLATADERRQALSESVGEANVWGKEQDYDSFVSIAEALRTDSLREDAMFALADILRSQIHSKKLLLHFLKSPFFSEVFSPCCISLH